jgi:hypothetical protein
MSDFGGIVRSELIRLGVPVSFAPPQQGEFCFRP